MTLRMERQRKDQPIECAPFFNTSNRWSETWTATFSPEWAQVHLPCRHRSRRCITPTRPVRLTPAKPPLPQPFARGATPTA